MEKLKRACAYCRVSTLLDKQETSLSSQIKYYNELFDNDPNLINAGIYVDQGISGRNVTKRREFQRMLHDCKEGKIDVIYCKSISRFGRDALKTLQAIEMLKNLGIPVMFDMDNINTLEDNDFNTILMSYLAQEEVEKDIEYNNSWVKHNQELGKVYLNGNNLYGYRYEPKTWSLRIVPEEAKVVKWIFESYVNGMRTKDIVSKLNEQGLQTSMHKPWKATSVIQILHQEKYKGDVILAKYYTDKFGNRKINHGEVKKFYVEKAHEPIVSDELWDKAQMILDKKRLHYVPKNAEYDPFRCMIYCGHCGNVFQRRAHKHLQSKDTNVSYRCGLANREGEMACKNTHSIRVATFRDCFIAVFNKLKEIESSIDFKSSYETKEMAEISKEIDGLLQKEKIYIQMNINDLLTHKLRQEYKDLIARVMELQEKKKKICQRSIEVAEANADISTAKNILSKYEKMIEFDESAFVAMIKRIVVKNRLEIVYEFKIGISMTVKVMPYIKANDDILEVIVNDSSKC